MVLHLLKWIILLLERLWNTSQTRSEQCPSYYLICWPLWPRVMHHQYYLLLCIRELMYTINESDCIALARLWLSSYQFRVETSCWAQIPFELRTCPYNTGIQSEHCVLLSCPRSQHLRRRFQLENFDNLSELFRHDMEQLAEYCRLI